MVVAQSELVACAQHALGVDAQDAATFDPPPVGHLGTERGERHHIADLHVERAAPHVSLGPVAHIDVDALHLGGVGVLLETQHLGRDDALDGVADVADLFDGEAERRHRVGQPLHRIGIGRVGEVAVVVQPGEEDLHRCRSFLRIAR